MTSDDHDKRADDETRRRFEQALARKHARSRGGAVAHEPGRSPVPQGNDKRQRTFRRKSG